MILVVVVSDLIRSNWKKKHPSNNEFRFGFYGIRISTWNACSVRILANETKVIF